MGLVKCPDCEKLVSERATSCPVCGCPREYFIKFSEKTDEEITKPKEITSLAENDIVFRIGSIKISYKKKSEECAKLFGKYAFMAHKSVAEIREKYSSARDINEISSRVIPFGMSELRRSIDMMIDDLYKRGIMVSPSEFEDKDNAYSFDYKNRCSIVEKLIDRCIRYRTELEQDEMIRQSSRGRWQAGGFNVKGAIKGAVTAGAMNAASDILHASGDRAREEDIKRSYAEKLKEAKDNSEAYYSVCDGLGFCILNAFRAYADILEKNGCLEIIPLSPKDAQRFYGDAKRYKTQGNREQYITLLTRSIMNNPGFEACYDELMYELVDTEPNELLEFMHFWNVSYISDKYEAEIKIGRIFDEEWRNDEIAQWWGSDKDYTMSYIRSREFCMKFYFSHNYLGIPNLSHYGSMLIKTFRETSNTYFIKDYKIIEWIPADVSFGEFLIYIKNERYALPNCAITNAWFIGDDINSLTSIPNSIDKNVLLMVVFATPGLFRSARGIGLTKDGIYDIKYPKIYIPFCEIRSVIAYPNNTLEIAVNESLKIKFADKKQFSNDALIYLANLIKVICVRYGNNGMVWSEEMSSERPESNMKFCFKCGQILDKNVRFCSRCGSDQEQTQTGISDAANVDNSLSPQNEVDSYDYIEKFKFCFRCGQKLDENIRFCSKCGSDQEQFREEAPNQDNNGNCDDKDGVVNNSDVIDNTTGNSSDSAEEEKIVFCAFCGKPISIKVKFCNFCGKPNTYIVKPNVLDETNDPSANQI